MDVRTRFLLIAGEFQVSSFKFQVFVWHTVDTRAQGNLEPGTWNLELTDGRGEDWLAGRIIRRGYSGVHHGQTGNTGILKETFNLQHSTPDIQWLRAAAH